MQYKYCSVSPEIKIPYFIHSRKITRSLTYMTALPLNSVRSPLHPSQLTKAPACDLRSFCLLSSFYQSDRFWLRGGGWGVTSFFFNSKIGFLAPSIAHMKQSTTTPERLLFKLKTYFRQHLECIWFVFYCFFQASQLHCRTQEKRNIVKKVTLERVKNKAQQKNRTLTPQHFHRYYQVRPAKVQGKSSI